MTKYIVVGFAACVWQPLRGDRVVAVPTMNIALVAELSLDTRTRPQSEQESIVRNGLQPAQSGTIPRERQITGTCCNSCSKCQNNSSDFSGLEFGYAGGLVASALVCREAWQVGTKKQRFTYQLRCQCTKPLFTPYMTPATGTSAPSSARSRHRADCRTGVRFFRTPQCSTRYRRHRSGTPLSR